VVAAARAANQPPSLQSLLVSQEWSHALAAEFSKPSFSSLERFLQAEWASGAQVFPPQPCIFRALNACRPSDIRVVILGQDPYHGAGQACGLSFSVAQGLALPSSLANIFKELSTDVGVPRPPHGDLERWAAQGVLLLNSVLTVRSGAANSHAGRGWEALTDAVIRSLARREQPLVFLLWGKAAQEKARLVLGGGGASRHGLLQAPHPSGLSAHRGFIGCRHFSAANAWLAQRGRAPVEWSTIG